MERLMEINLLLKGRQVEISLSIRKDSLMLDQLSLPIKLNPMEE